MLCATLQVKRRGGLTHLDPDIAGPGADQLATLDLFNGMGDPAGASGHGKQGEGRVGGQFQPLRQGHQGKVHIGLEAGDGGHGQSQLLHIG